MRSIFYLNKHLSLSTSISEVHRKTNLIYDRPTQQVSATQAAIGSQQNQIDPSILNQINDGVRNARIEVANALKVSLVLSSMVNSYKFK